MTKISSEVNQTRQPWSLMNLIRHKCNHERVDRLKNSCFILISLVKFKCKVFSSEMIIEHSFWWKVSMYRVMGPYSLMIKYDDLHMIIPNFFQILISPFRTSEPEWLVFFDGPTWSIRADKLLLKCTEAILDHFGRGNRSWNNWLWNNLFQNNSFTVKIESVGKTEITYSKIDYSMWNPNPTSWRAHVSLPFQDWKLCFKKSGFKKMIHVRGDYITTGYYCNIFIHI